MADLKKLFSFSYKPDFSPKEERKIAVYNIPLRKEPLFFIAGYENDVIPNVTSSYHTIGDTFAECGIRIKMPRDKFVRIKAFVEEDMKEKLKSQQIDKNTIIRFNIALQYNDQGYAEFMYTSYLPQFDSEVVNALVNVGIDIKTLIKWN